MIAEAISWLFDKIAWYFNGMWESFLYWSDWFVREIINTCVWTVQQLIDMVWYLLEPILRMIVGTLGISSKAIDLVIDFLLAIPGLVLELCRGFIQYYNVIIGIADGSVIASNEYMGVVDTLLPLTEICTLIVVLFNMAAAVVVIRLARGAVSLVKGWF